MVLRLRILNAVLHVLHVALMLFILLGWIFPETRGFHLALIVVTLGSWWSLGYCPLTELHWKIRRSAGLPVAQGPYIPFLAAHVTGHAVDIQSLDRAVVILTLLIAALSALLNLKRIL